MWSFLWTSCKVWKEENNFKCLIFFFLLSGNILLRSLFDWQTSVFAAHSTNRCFLILNCDSPADRSCRCSSPPSPSWLLRWGHFLFRQLHSYFTKVLNRCRDEDRSIVTSMFKTLYRKWLLVAVLCYLYFVSELCSDEQLHQMIENAKIWSL